MPIVDGWASTALIREKEKARPVPSRAVQSCGRTPIFAVSGMLRRGDEKRYIDAGFDGWMPKPIDMKHLAVCLGGAWDGSMRFLAGYDESHFELGGWFPTQEATPVPEVIPEPTIPEAVPVPETAAATHDEEYPPLPATPAGQEDYGREDLSPGSQFGAISPSVTHSFDYPRSSREDGYFFRSLDAEIAPEELPTDAAPNGTRSQLPTEWAGEMTPTTPDHYPPIASPWRHD